MRISEILAPERIRCDVHATSKKQALEALSELLARNLTDSASVFDCLQARERLGSTGLGRGVAIPHGRLPQLTRAVGAFVKIAEGVDFDAPDGEPVDLLFGLLVPQSSTKEHLQILSQLAECFDQGCLREKLRASESAESVFEVLTSLASPS